MVMANPISVSEVALAKIDSGHLAVRGQQRPAGIPGLHVTGQPVDLLGGRVVAVDVRHQDRGDVLDGGRLGLEGTAVGVAGERGSDCRREGPRLRGSGAAGSPSTASTARSCLVSK